MDYCIDCLTDIIDLRKIEMYRSFDGLYMKVCITERIVHLLVLLDWIDLA